MVTKEKENHLGIEYLILGISISLAVAWIGGFFLEHESLWVRLGLLGMGIVLSGMSLWVIVQKKKRDKRLFRNHIEALCRLESQSVGSGNVSPLPKWHPYQKLGIRIQDRVREHLGRIGEFEQNRTVQDVRSRRAASQLEKMKNIFSGIDDPIMVIDDYDELVLTNASAVSLFGLEIEKAETRALRQLLHCEKLVELLVSTRQRKVSGSRSEEIEIMGPGGETHWYRATACKMDSVEKDAENACKVAEGAVLMLRNIGDHKVMQKRHAEFVSAVSHEMKTPLAGIKAYVELLADGEAEDEKTREEFLEVISTQANRLQRLVENLLNIARIEAGVVHVNKEQSSLNEVLEQALHVVQPSAEAKNIDLRMELSSMFLGVLADRDMLLQGAINLLSNAIKYTQPGGRVTLRSRMADNQVRFEVEDTGVGLSEEDSTKVFEKFYRVKKDKEMANGTGLGLPLAKHIVEDVHGGQLTLQSVLGEGSTFIVSLPSAEQLRNENSVS